MSVNWSVLLVWLGLAIGSVQAQPNRAYALGDMVADFTLKNVDGRTITLADYKAQKGLIIIFSSNHCPFSRIYEERVQSLNARFGPLGYPVLAIMPNDPTAYEDDSYENMQRRAREQNFGYAYGLDEHQLTARRFGVIRTPQAFVLKQTGGQFVLEYTGAIDDSPQDRAGVQRRYVDEAVTSLLAGRPVASPITKPIGCAVMWKP